MNPFDRFANPEGMRGDEFKDGDDENDEREYEAEEDTKWDNHCDDEYFQDK